MRRPRTWPAVARKKTLPPFIACLALLLSATAALAARETLFVTVKKTSIRKDRQFYAPTVAEAVFRDRLGVLAREPGWVRVSFKGFEGWVHVSATAAQAVSVTSKDATGGVSQDDVAFAIIGTEAVKEFTGANLTKLTEAFAGTVDDIIDQMVSLGYSRGQEYAADAESCRIAFRTGYNPAGLAEFLRTLQAKSVKGDNKGFFSSHPPAVDRLAKAEALLAGEKLSGPTDPVRTARFSKTR